MATILTLRDISLSYGEQILLDKAEMVINQKEVVSIIGRNGEGKSTLLKLIAKIIQADSGEYHLANGHTIAYMPQEVPEDIEGDVFTVVASGLEEVSTVMIAYHQATQETTLDPSEKNLNKLAKAQEAMEDVNGWNFNQQISTILSKINVAPDVQFNTLSGGVKRRVLLGRELVKNPDLLLLDEPTNHLDIASILWLENFIKSLSCSVLLITHDRRFMQNVTTRILELDRGLLTSWPGDYENFLRRKAERDNAEAKANARFDKKLSQEEVWIRQGIKARRTRNEGRVRKLEAMRSELKARRQTKGTVDLKLQTAERSGKIVIEAEHITHDWIHPDTKQSRTVISDFSTLISRGNKIGIIGANGCGKTTLLNILLGKTTATQGKVKLGTKLQIAYFDQLTSALDLEKSLQDNIGEGSDNILVNGQTRHITSYLQDFLFTPQQGRQPVKSLSGGERNRAMLAKLFTQPANMLVLDEPTNDLDIETLDLLEELLINYDGTVILVSHDRKFLDNVVTSSIIFETDGDIYESIGGYSDWQTIRNDIVKDASNPKAKKSEKQKKPIQKTKLSYKDQQALEKTPKQIEKLEQEIADIQNQLADPKLYKEMSDNKTETLTQSLSTHEGALEGLYEEWERLESL